MGVQGLWDLLAPVGRRVSVETLAGKKLAIDASIWMVQFMKAMRDERGEMVRNAHLLGFFRRICKLLFLRTRPVFVFDGGTPALKRRTVAARRRLRENARAKIRKTAEKLLINHLKARKLEELAEEMKRMKEKSDAKGKQVVADDSGGGSTGMASEGREAGVSGVSNQESLDELLAKSLAAEEEGGLMGVRESSVVGATEEEGEDGEDDEELMLPAIHGNIDPNILASLPPSVQLDLLVQMREKLMAENRQKYQKIKKVPAKFSELQIQSYLKTVAFRREIDEVQKVAAGKGLGGVQTSRIASEANREFIFSSSFTGNKQMLTSLTATEGSGEMQPGPLVRELVSEAGVQSSSTGQLKFASDSRVEEPISSFDTDVETYRDERGRVRVSRIRALGIRMTRDLERNLALMKEHEQEHYMKDASVAAEPSCSGAGSVDVSSVDTPLVQAASSAGNKSVMEISFLDGDHDSHGDVSDHFFQHLVAGNSADNFFQESTSVGKCSKDSDSDDLWDDGVNNIEDKGQPDASNQNQKIESSCSEEGEEWEDIDIDFPQMPSQNDTVSNRTYSKGILEEQAEIQEAIRRSLEDVRQRNLEEPTYRGPVMDNDGNTALSPQNNIIERDKFEQAIVDSVLQVDSAIEEDLEDQSSFKGFPATMTGMNGARGSLESKGMEEKNEYSRHAQFKSKSRDICLEVNTENLSLNIVQEGQNLEKKEGDSAEASSLDYSHSTCKLQNVTLEDDSKKAGLLSPNPEIVVSNHKQVEESFVGVPKIKNQYDNHGREEPSQKNDSTSDHLTVKVSQSSIDIANMKEMTLDKLQLLKDKDNFLEMTLDKLQLLKDKDNFLETHTDTPQHNLEEMSLPQSPQPQPSFNEEISRLRQERESLGDEQRRQEINAESVSSEMFAECQELLQMFGLPYIIAPMEAEAQCAYMESVNLVDGVVTDDSDVFLFGAQSVYKNIFDDRKYVETYFMKDMESELGLTREKLIRMALLLGSDYTEGVSGIGIVNAIEVVHAFPEGDGLQKFREWLESPDPGILEKIDPHIGSSSKKKSSKLAKTEEVEWHLESDGPNSNKPIEETVDTLSEAKMCFMSKHRNVSKNWHIPSSFPSQSVISAYSSPQVDESTEPFSWGKPDLLLLRKLCWERFGWPNQKADELLLPVLKEYNKHETQLRLEAFYSFNERFAKIRSQRIKKAVKGITGKLSAGLLGDPVQDDIRPQEKAGGELEPSGFGEQSELDGIDRKQGRDDSQDKHVGQGNNEASKGDNIGQRGGGRGHGRGGGNVKSRVSGGRKGRGRGRARGRRRAKPDNQSSESGASDGEKSIGESADIASKAMPEMRRSVRQRKMARYTEESSEDDDLSGLPNTSDSMVANQEISGKDVVTGIDDSGMLEDCDQLSMQSCDHPEDGMPKDYLLSGGGFCAEKDGASAAGDLAARTTSLGEMAGSDKANSEEPAHLDAEGLGSNVGVSGLRAMPMLRRKRKKML